MIQFKVGAQVVAPGVGVVTLNGIPVGPPMDPTQVTIVGGWLEASVDILLEAMRRATTDVQPKARGGGLYLDLVDCEGTVTRLETPTPILGVNEASETFVLFGGDLEDMSPRWQRMYNPTGPPSRGQRLMMAAYALEQWNVFNKRQLVGTVEKKVK